MNTDNGTVWNKVSNAIIIYHQQEERPLWLSREDLEEMLRVLEGVGGWGIIIRQIFSKLPEQKII